MTITKKPDTRPAPASWGLAASGRLPWEYASAPEATDHITIERSYGLFIDNEFRPGRGGLERRNPATDELVAANHGVHARAAAAQRHQLR